MTGRGRDACRNLGIPRSPETALTRALAPGTRLVDAARVAWPDGRRRFVVAAVGAGFDARVAARAARLHASGTLPYLAAVIAELRTFAPSPVRVHRDGVLVVDGPVVDVVVANGACYGGGMRIAPAADVEDGELDLVILGALGRLELLRWLPTLYWGGHVRHPEISTARARTVDIETADLPVHVDGEAGGRTPVRVDVVPGALRVRA